MNSQQTNQCQSHIFSSVILFCTKVILVIYLISLIHKLFSTASILQLELAHSFSLVH